MKRQLLPVLLAGCLCANAGHAASLPDIQAADSAARTWLALIDSNDFAASWQQAAALFKSSISQQQWLDALHRARTPLGKLQARTLQSAVPAHTLPGAPPGDYVVIQYRARFDNRAEAIETVTPQREADGSWRVAGYFIN
ncbi:DUF4019 domain-containing protein [Vogesella fluminis]|uniref:DUF4019 domain-containing protein n=1 Tax=Vogesella fluminis TaxID=1069161 RepID=A0ABQ3HBP2_9NEIS|nr:DUF4019 domain-containing protein [Vogesella fluminis]GHD78554.1 hypothetical protein GCM10011419_20780 [Vogesella fluminis]